ncbi:hypothetical protein P154DRAFT_593484 [Amniculicola lignicola CBS 123094]|uniref:Uncharacterized protein n=1 Tax=Amniculicola lignicola CBS 123094 TaxID=1392246 RepID=A0A6A5W135_9PLEO|nr:hypothetical protein P154DRAFT_593484 [Amniculicola lignicola CBS 123094]
MASVNRMSAVTKRRIVDEIEKLLEVTHGDPDQADKIIRYLASLQRKYPALTMDMVVEVLGFHDPKIGKQAAIGIQFIIDHEVNGKELNSTEYLLSATTSVQSEDSTVATKQNPGFPRPRLEALRNAQGSANLLVGTTGKGMGGLMKKSAQKKNKPNRAKLGSLKSQKFKIDLECFISMADRLRRDLTFHALALEALPFNDGVIPEMGSKDLAQRGVKPCRWTDRYPVTYQYFPLPYQGGGLLSKTASINREMQTTAFLPESTQFTFTIAAGKHETATSNPHTPRTAIKGTVKDVDEGRIPKLTLISVEPPKKDGITTSVRNVFADQICSEGPVVAASTCKALVLFKPEFAPCKPSPIRLMPSPLLSRILSKFIRHFVMPFGPQFPTLNSPKTTGFAASTCTALIKYYKLNTLFAFTGVGLNPKATITPFGDGTFESGHEGMHINKGFVPVGQTFLDDSSHMVDVVANSSRENTPSDDAPSMASEDNDYHKEDDRSSVTEITSTHKSRTHKTKHRGSSASTEPTQSRASFHSGSTNSGSSNRSMSTGAFDLHSTLIGTVSMYDFAKILGLSKSRRVSKRAIVKAWVTASINEHELMGKNPHPFTKRPELTAKDQYRQAVVKIGSVSLLTFLREIVADADGKISHSAFYAAFKKCADRDAEVNADESTQELAEMLFTSSESDDE